MRIGIGIGVAVEIGKRDRPCNFRGPMAIATPTLMADPDDSVKAAMSGSQPKAHGFAGGCLLDGFSAQNYDPAAPTRYEIL